MSKKPDWAQENPYEGAWLGFEEAVANFDRTLDWIESLTDEEYRFAVKLAETDGVHQSNGTEH